MKLLIVTQKLDSQDDILGFFHEWVEHFARQVEMVTVICLYEGKHSLPPNVRVMSLGKEKGVGKITYLTNFISYIWKEKSQYDTVFVHMNPIYIVLAGWWWKMMGKKLALWYTHKHVDLKLKIAEKFTDVILSASKESFRLDTPKLIVTGHGIDTELFKPGTMVEPHIMRIITIGRISPVKDYESVLEAVSQLAQQGLDVRLDILGKPATSSDEQYYASLRAIVERKHLEDKVSFVGSVPHHSIVPYLQQSTVFVNMSHTGSLDKAVLEAMACGLIVVTSNESFAPLFGQYKDILMTEPNKPAMLATKLAYFQSNDTKAIRSYLRDIVVRDHNLARLITKVSAILGNIT